eukprot:CAMPEP_0196660452 /NCGR_PEP_ID=MMETSP1086-20130531/39851_1 /TAXON_ID=77921 /ORGANISM="Cyanoptyche  gloeocystis , Strain SAG4.97" /LENGTH=137 /DNA_ID=CAMNT_0041994879 /DNA_START=206 /DNA_END=617 /DNA_ORIENTATION=-
MAAGRASSACGISLLHFIGSPTAFEPLQPADFGARLALEKEKEVFGVAARWRAASVQERVQQTGQAGFSKDLWLSSGRRKQGGGLALSCGPMTGCAGQGCFGGGPGPIVIQYTVGPLEGLHGGGNVAQAGVAGADIC